MALNPRNKLNAASNIPETSKPDMPAGRNIVRDMFADIAPSYDKLNHILSLNIDKLWRRFTVNKLPDVLDGVKGRGAVALDLCCGTADLTIEIARRFPSARVFGCDFCRPMLEVGNKKIFDIGNVSLIEGDALKLPFANESFDAVTIAFGLRNLEDKNAGLEEIHRVLKRGGRTAILEFSTPVIPVFRNLFNWYFNKVLPAIGNVISGNCFAYKYLPESVKSFPDQKTLAEMMRTNGFSNVSYHNLSGGIAALHVGEK